MINQIVDKYVELDGKDKKPENLEEFIQMPTYSKHLFLNQLYD
jgi:hypothetical protein